MNILIPDEIAQATRMTRRELPVEIAVLLFERERLSLGQASRLAEMSPRDFQHLLGRRGISLHYGVNEFEEDLATLKELRRS